MTSVGLRRRAFKAVLLASVVTGVAAPVAAATPPPATIRVGQPTLRQEGLSLTVPVTVTCSPAYKASIFGPPSLRVVVKQKVASGGIASGSGIAFPIACDAAPHHYPVSLDAAGFAFTTGQAFVHGTFNAVLDSFSFYTQPFGPLTRNIIRAT
jgi:hypothetical protein